MAFAIKSIQSAVSTQPLPVVFSSPQLKSETRRLGVSAEASTANDSRLAVPMRTGRDTGKGEKADENWKTKCGD